MYEYYNAQNYFIAAGETSKILVEILDELEKLEKIESRDPMDKAFFTHAMEVACKHLHYMQAGDRLHKLLMTKNNYKFIGGRLKVSFVDST